MTLTWFAAGVTLGWLLRWLLACDHEGDCRCIGEWDDSELRRRLDDGTRDGARSEGGL